jgi:hypothetical protein
VLGAKSGAVLSLHCPHARSQPALVDTAHFARCDTNACKLLKYSKFVYEKLPGRMRTPPAAVEAQGSRRRPPWQ